MAANLFGLTLNMARVLPTRLKASNTRTGSEGRVEEVSVAFSVFVSAEVEPLLLFRSCIFMDTSPVAPEEDKTKFLLFLLLLSTKKDSTREATKARVKSEASVMLFS